MSDRVRPEPAKYKTKNWSSYNQALKARGALMIWLDRDLQWSGLASGKRGRPSLFSDAAIQFCLTIKGLFGLALRQAMGMVESLLKLAGLSWPVPDYSTVCRRQKTLQVRIPYRPAAQGLHLLVDSTGLKMMGEWKRLAIYLMPKEYHSSLKNLRLFRKTFQTHVLSLYVRH